MAASIPVSDHNLPKIETAEPVPIGYSSGKSVPWWVKMGSKLVLARLPIPYALWRSLGLFRYGTSDESWTRERAFATECMVLATSELGRPPKAVLEFGPGDSLVGAIVSSALGAERAFIVDVGDFASVDVSKYAKLISDLDKETPGFAARVDLSSRDALLKSVNATYFTNGLSDLMGIADESVELSFSLKVVEHIRKAEFEPLMAKLAKVMCAPSVQRHVVDLHDHMGCALNSLRFTEGFWENSTVASSGFYTNRLRFSQIVQVAETVGLKASVPHALIWPSVPTPKSRMHPQFQSYLDADLQVCTFDMVLRK